MNEDGTREEGGYDPADDLTKVSGASYLEVKNRIKWLRDRDPDAVITSELIREGEAAALFKATVKLATGGYAEAHGSETKSDFRDFLEKAETKALGRALAMLGFGTQFVDSELEGRQGARVVDAPVRQARPTQRQYAQDRSERAVNGSRATDEGRERQSAPARNDAPTRGGADKPIVERQKKAILDLAKRGGYTEDELDQIVAKESGGLLILDEISFEAAAAVIGALRKPKDDGGKA